MVHLLMLPELKLYSGANSRMINKQLIQKDVEGSDHGPI
jgi:hypothetical protein